MTTESGESVPDPGAGTNGATADSEPLPHGIGPHNPQGGRPQTAHDRRHIEDRRALVETLELAGATVRQIAEQTHTSISTVDADLKAVRRMRRERLGVIDLEAERALELERLEQQRMWLTRLAQGGSVGANRTLVRISESKRKLLGLDAPERVALSFDPYEAIVTGLDRATLAALATREPGQIIDLPATAVIEDTDDEPAD